jgi:PPOX class probable F420-dependent enzyme
MKITEPARKVLESNALAHVVTVGEDGAAHVTLAWVGVDGDEIVMATLFDQKKLIDMRQDPRVVLSFETPIVNDWGMHEYLVVYGRAEVTEGGAPELLQELAYTYLGPDAKYPPMPDPPPGFITRITPERFKGTGSWVDSAT